MISGSASGCWAVVAARMRMRGRDFSRDPAQWPYQAREQDVPLSEKLVGDEYDPFSVPW
ncbi:hypothetical protein F4558_004237 [Micromonospora profundi]|nr:hypothetical protein [Micromonospora profundi]